MIHPVHLLGSPILREATPDVASDSPELQQLIDDMIETMHAARGIGLAAPQIGRGERLFVVDVSSMEEDFEEIGAVMPAQPMVFLNAHIVEDSDEETDFEEGCLSIPDIHETVVRPEQIRIQYLDRTFTKRDETFDGVLARVIQHEYDHIEGILFIDHLSALKRRLLKRRLADIREGNVTADYVLYADGVGVIDADPESDDD